MTTIKINTKNHTIEMPSKKYALAASKYGSDEYIEVQNARHDYPNYKVVTRKAAKRKDTLKGLTYDVMERYIASHDTNNEIRNHYDFLRGNSEETSSRSTYGEIKAWFLTTYPNYGKYPQSTISTNIQ